MEAFTTLATIRPALANGAPSIPESSRPRRRHVLDPHPLPFSSSTLLCLPSALRALGLVVGVGLGLWCAGLLASLYRGAVAGGMSGSGLLCGPVVVLGSGGVEGGSKRETDKPAATSVVRGRGRGGAGRRQERRPAPEPAPACVAGRWGVIRSDGWKPIAQPRRMPEGQEPPNPAQGGSYRPRGALAGNRLPRTWGWPCGYFRAGVVLGLDLPVEVFFPARQVPEVAAPSRRRFPLGGPSPSPPEGWGLMR